MNEPDRLSQTNHEAGKLLAAARSYKPDEASKRRAATALGLTMATGGASFLGAASSATAAVKVGLLTKMSLAVVLCASTTGAVVTHYAVGKHRHGQAKLTAERPRQPVKAAPLPAYPQTSNDRPAPVSPSPVGASPPATPPASPPLHALAHKAPRTRATEPRVAPPLAPIVPPVDTLAFHSEASAPQPTEMHRGLAPSASARGSDFDLIANAEQYLQTGKNNDALIAANRYLELHSRGTYVEEALLIRIEAHLAKADVKRAADLAHNFVASHPNSLLLARVRRLLVPMQETGR